MNEGMEELQPSNLEWLSKYPTITKEVVRQYKDEFSALKKSLKNKEDLRNEDEKRQFAIKSTKKFLGLIDRAIDDLMALKWDLLSATQSRQRNLIVNRLLILQKPTFNFGSTNKECQKISSEHKVSLLSKDAQTKPSKSEKEKLANTENTGEINVKNKKYGKIKPRIIRDVQKDIPVAVVDNQIAGPSRLFHLSQKQLVRVKRREFLRVPTIDSSDSEFELTVQKTTHKTVPIIDGKKNMLSNPSVSNKKRDFFKKTRITNKKPPPRRISRHTNTSKKVVNGGSLKLLT